MTTSTDTPPDPPTGIGAISTAFLMAGVLGQVYAQAVALALG
jgi:hypothetical protein